MAISAMPRRIDSAPPRPSEALPQPARVLRVEVDVDAANLANPMFAVSLLLTNEANALNQVVGDEERFEVCLVLPADDAQTLSLAESWIRWAVHVVGVRGRLTRLAPPVS